MQELKDRATKDLKDAIERYEAKVQQLSNKIQEQQESLSKVPLPVIPQPQLSPAKPSEEILDKSLCALDPKEIAFLKSIMGEKAFVTYLLFRVSRDGLKGIDFHSRSDRKGPTISLYRVKDGDCIGGFTRA